MSADLCGWPCVGAAGHDGDHMLDPAFGHVRGPLRGLPREELIQAAALAFARAQTVEREAAESLALSRAWERDVIALASRALAEGKSPHGNDHTADCWKRSAHCLAFVIMRPGVRRALDGS